MFTDSLPTLTEILARRPRGLVVDIDGTISRIAPTPAAATVSPACRAALAALVGQLDLVAAISGRPAAQARAMVNVPGMVYIGNHGLERWGPGGTTIMSDSEPYVAALARSLLEARQRIREPGVVFERKGPTAAVHYRLAPDPAAAERAILAVLRPLALELGLRVRRGRRVVELLPPVAVDKGTALSSLITERRLRGVIYIGDDLTDTDAFATVHQLRASGIAGLAVGVQSAELPAPVARGADRLVPGVPGVEVLLAHLVDLTHPPQSSGSAGERVATPAWDQPWDRPGDFEKEGS